MIFTTARFWEVHAIDSIYYGEILAGGKAGLGSAAGLVRGFVGRVGWAGERLGWVGLVRGFVGSWVALGFVWVSFGAWGALIKIMYMKKGLKTDTPCYFIVSERWGRWGAPIEII